MHPPLRLRLAPAVFVLVLALPVLACGTQVDRAGAEPDALASAGTPDAPRLAARPDATLARVPDAAPDAAPRCAGRPALAVGDQTYTITHDGLDRTVLLHVPPGYDPTRPTPLVLDFHALAFSAADQVALSKMSPKADAEGFLVAYPEGTMVPRSWNAGLCCAPATTLEVDDVGFVRDLLADLDARACVDDRRVFATGMSNGGFLSHRLGCELSDRIAAIAPVAGVMGIASCNPTRPVPVIEFHGTDDAFVPYLGGGVGPFPPVLTTFEGWAARDGCTGAAAITFAEDDVTCRTYAACAGGAEVSLCTVQGGGHTWPGGGDLPLGGHTTTTISATDRMWDFFVRHPLPQ